MAYATAVSSPITLRQDGFRFTAEPCSIPARQRRQWWEVCPHPEQDLCLEEGEFQLNGPHGTRRIARFTGRKRWVNKTYVPTIEVFDIATVVEMVGELPVIVGRRGERLKGTWWISPQAVNYNVVFFK
jgi:hypothetical protein